MDRFAVGDAWTNRGRRVDARALTRGDIVSDWECHTAYPRYMKAARGAHVWDVDGNRYIDYLLGYGPVILGHADPVVTDAVIAELATGHCMAPLWSPRQVELAELLTSIVPGAEHVLFLKTGSDATSAAVRLARIFTGRDTIVRSGYNGWHDWSVPQPAGVPESTRSKTIVFDYHDLASLRRAVDRRVGQVAAVVTMPFEDERTSAAHLTEIGRIAHSAGALLILDEMRSGFRLALGGAQEYFGVRADLTTFSKALANGYAISAVTGRTEIMAGLASTKISSTFFANPADMVAAAVTVSTLRDTDAISRTWSMGERLQNGLASLAAAEGLPAQVVGYPPLPFMRFTFDDHVLNDIATHAFFVETTARGLLLHPSHQWFLSAAHTADDIDATLEGCCAAMRAAADAVS